MDLYELPTTIDKILNAHRNGSRDEYQTSENLKALLDGLDEQLRQRSFEYLLVVMSQEIGTPHVERAAGRVLRPDILAVIIRICSVHGPVTQTYTLLFSHLQ